MQEFKRINDYSAWEPFGKGGRGTTYRSKEDPSVILKMDNRGVEKYVREEFELSKKVSSLGIPTPKVYDLITDGKLYGYTAQLIKGKKSLCRIVSEDPSRMDGMAKLFAERALEFHSKKYGPSEPVGESGFDITDMKQRTIECIKTNKYLTDKTKETILAEIQSIPDTGTCLMGDFHFGNLITTGENDYWIDLGEFTHASPAFDLARFGFSLELPSFITKNLFHVDNRQLKVFYDKFLAYYLEGYERMNGTLQREELLRQVKIAGQSSRIGVMMNAPLAFLFLPRLQRYRGDKPSCRLPILWKLICGKKLY